MAKYPPTPSTATIPNAAAMRTIAGVRRSVRGVGAGVGAGAGREGCFGFGGD